MNIPKLVHISWNDKKLLQNHHPLILNGIGNFHKLNVDWKIEISNDFEVNNYLKNVLKKDDYKIIKNFHIVSKTDLWRLFKIYLEGGLYVDVDRLCNVSMSSFLDDKAYWFLPICNYSDFSHDIMCSSPFNPTYLTIIKLYLERIRQGYNQIYFLGPQTYMHGITLSLFNQIIDCRPGKDKFIEMEKKLNTFSFIKTYNELPPSKTILYNGIINKYEWESLKRSFYAENNIKHWTGEW